MFEPFPGNYAWHLSINLALLAGGNHGELDEVCRPVREAALQGEKADTALLFDAWWGVARQLIAMAQQAYNLAVNGSSGSGSSRPAKTWRSSTSAPTTASSRATTSRTG